MTIAKENSFYNQSLPSLPGTLMHRKNHRRVRLALEKNGAFKQGAKWLVALSGGIDSSILLHHTAVLGAKRSVSIVAAHVHHGVRGKEADRDAESAEHLSRKLGCEFHVLHVGKKLGTKIAEERLREVRFKALEELAERIGAHRILLGHQRDDQAETVLMRLLGGSDLRGIGAMQLFRPPLWVRPLLEVTREEIVQEAEACEIPFVEDSTNRLTVYRRNFLRKNVIPLLTSQFNPQLTSHLCALAESLQDVTHFMEQSAFELLRLAEVEKGSYRVKTLRGAKPVLRQLALQVAFREVAGMGAALNRSQVQVMEHLVMSDGPERMYALPRKVRILRRKEMLEIGKID